MSVASYIVKPSEHMYFDKMYTKYVCKSTDVCEKVILKMFASQLLQFPPKPPKEIV